MVYKSNVNYENSNSLKDIIECFNSCMFCPFFIKHLETKL